MGIDRNFVIVEEHRKELIQQAEKYRLIEQALAGMPKRTNLWISLIQWTGDRLVDLGCFLQTCYSNNTRKPTEAIRSTPCGESY